MRTLLPEEMKEQPLFTLAVGFTLVVMVGFVVTGFLLYFQHMDLSPSSVVSYFSGSEQDYRPARSMESMLSVTHAHMIAMGMALLLLSILLIRSSLSSGTKKAFIVLPFSSAILSEASSWLVWFGVPGFGWVKVLSFLMLQISLTVVVFLLFVAYFRPARKPAEPGFPPRQQSPAPQHRGGPPHRGAPQQRGGPQQPGGQQQRGGPQHPGAQPGEHRRRRRRPRRRGGEPRPGGQTPPPTPPPPSA